jgi:hypothetical protein
MGSNISYEIKYVVTRDMALALWSMWQQQPRIMGMQNADCCFSHCPAKLQYEFWKVRETRKKCSQNSDMTMWFVAEKCNQEGPDRNLYANWIILPKEQFSFRITGFLDFVHRQGRGGRQGDTYYVGSLRKSRPQSLDSFCFPPKPLISLCQLFKP